VRPDEVESSMITQLSTIAFPYEPKDASSTQSAKQREFDLVCVVCVCVCVCVGLPSFFLLCRLRARALMCVCLSSHAKGVWCIRHYSQWLSRTRMLRSVCMCLQARARSHRLFFSLSLFSLSLTRYSLARSLLRALSPPALALAGGYCGGEYLP